MALPSSTHTDVTFEIQGGKITAYEGQETVLREGGRTVAKLTIKSVE